MPKKQFIKPEVFFKAFGNRIKRLRLKNGWTQEQMADFGFSYRFYQRIEAGKPIHMKTVIKLANAFEMGRGQLLG